ncbi:MAG: type II toxin-antitoxin system HicA family toxin [Nitrospirae bacterium]|nr:type II toxin-antitoxin system HicA family toxin [Nitrospirota bacterium]
MSQKFPTATSDEIIRVLKIIGFRFKRQSGSSHAIYYRDIDKKRTCVPIHKTKELKRKTLKAILLDAGLTVEEFIDLLKR